MAVRLVRLASTPVVPLAIVAHLARHQRLQCGHGDAEKGASTNTIHPRGASAMEANATTSKQMPTAIVRVSPKRA
jgi:hypothetical protein